MRPVYVAGVGLHPFGRFAEKSLHRARHARGARGARRRRRRAGRLRGRLLRQRLRRGGGRSQGAHRARLSGVPIVNVEAGCASGGAGARPGRDRGGERAPRRRARLRAREDAARHHPLELLRAVAEEAGLAATPAYFALRAQRLMLESDVRLEDLARVSANNHRHGVANPYAMYRRALLRGGDPGLAGRLRATPAPHAVRAERGRRGRSALGGAHARARRRRGAPLAPRGLGAGRAHAALRPGRRWGPDADRDGGRRRLRGGRPRPGDLHLVELQDTDAAREILSAEELGLCAKRGGGRWVRDGGGEMASRLPVNPSGGLLSKASRLAPRPSARSSSSPGSSAARRGRARCPARRSRSRTRWAAARTPASLYWRPETMSRVGDGRREFRPVNRAHGVPRPAKPARQTCRSVSASRRRVPERDDADCPGPHLCRAGFAGHGTTFARSTDATRSLPDSTRDKVSGRVRTACRGRQSRRGRLAGA